MHGAATQRAQRSEWEKRTMMSCTVLYRTVYHLLVFYLEMSNVKERNMVTTTSSMPPVYAKHLRCMIEITNSTTHDEVHLFNCIHVYNNEVQLRFRNETSPRQTAQCVSAVLAQRPDRRPDISYNCDLYLRAHKVNTLGRILCSILYI